MSVGVEARDLFEVVQPKTGIPGDYYTNGALALGPEIDTAGAAGVNVFVECSQVDAGATLDVCVYDCATSGGVFAKITGSDMTQITAATTETITLWQAHKRYVKLAYTLGTNLAKFSACVLLSGRRASG